MVFLSNDVSWDMKHLIALFCNVDINGVINVDINVKILTLCNIVLKQNIYPNSWTPFYKPGFIQSRTGKHYRAFRNWIP